MDIEQIRLADIRNELLPCGLDVFINRCDPDGNLSGTVFKFTRSDGNPLPKASLWIDDESISPTELAAIGRALLAAAGEGPLIPLADAVRVVEEAFRFRTVTHKYDAASNEVHTSVDGVFYPQGTYKRITEETKLADAIAALQALGGGE